MTAGLVTDGVMAGLAARRKAAEAALGAAVLRDCAAYVPYRTGELAASGVVVDGGVEYRAGHARRVYYGEGMHFWRDVHPLACAQWFEKAKAAHGDAWARETEAVF